MIVHTLTPCSPLIAAYVPSDQYQDRPEHVRDNVNKAFRPDENDTMLVLADCMVHYVRQPRTDLLAGIAAPCVVTTGGC